MRRTAYLARRARRPRGLLCVIVALARVHHVAWAVGASIGTACWFIAQLLGGAIGTLQAVILYSGQPSPVRAGEPARLAS